jgi:hypothetical protein
MPISRVKKTRFDFSFLAAPDFPAPLFFVIFIPKRRRPNSPRNCRKKTILFFRQRKMRIYATGMQIVHFAVDASGATLPAPEKRSSQAGAAAKISGPGNSFFNRENRERRENRHRFFRGFRGSYIYYE